MTPQQMRDNLLVLEKDGIFYSKFMKCYETGQFNACIAREVIQLAISQLKLTVAVPEEREEMRLYFEERYDLMPSNVINTRTPTNLLDESAKPLPPTPTTTPTPITTPITMSKAITITTQVNVNGVNADNYTDAQLFDMIRQQETEIKHLQALTNKPQSLLREMETRQAGIVALVSFMDERDAKLNPVQPTAQPTTQPTATDQPAR